MKRILTILILILITLNVIATKYYVATDGNDSYTEAQAQNIATPWASWKHGIDMLSAGDTLYIRGGVYTPANETTRSAYVYLNALTSSRTAPLVISIYPPDFAAGDSAVLDCRYQVASPQGYNNGMEMTECHYIKFFGLTICNVRQDQRSLDLENYGEYGHKTPGWTFDNCTNLIFESCHSHHNGGAGFNIINFSESIIDTTMMINCDAYDNADSLSTYSTDGGLTWIRQAGNGADGIFIQVWDTFLENYSIVEGCRAWGNTDDGINFDQACLTVIRNNWAFNNGDATLSHSEGNGLKIGDPPPHTPDWISRYVHNNIAANNDGFGYDPNNGLGDEWPRAWTYNNLSYNNEIGYLIQWASEAKISDTANVYKNNISYQDTRPFFDVPLAQGDYTNYITSSCTWLSAYEGGNYNGTISNPNYTVTADDFVSLDVSQLLRPRKSDGSLPDITFGTLAEGSDLIDGGETDYRFTGLGLTYNGSAPDLGWYESGIYEEPLPPGPIDGLIITHNGKYVSIGNRIISRIATPIPESFTQIIADHTVVDRYDDIPQSYIDEVKKMWMVYAGESHSYGPRYGLMLLEALDANYAVNVTDGYPWVAESPTPEAYTTSHLRASGARWGDYDNASGWIYWHGEEDWWTNATAIARTKASISYCHSNNLTVSAMGFGWCWDPMGTGPTETADPVYGVHWWGSSENGPNGSRAWGLDASDFAITGNGVSMDTYISVMQEYVDYCITNSIPTKVFFTTGPVDNYNGNLNAENMYQAYLKYEHLRDWVDSQESVILFDYADILCYDDDGTPATTTWDGHTYPTITNTNNDPEIEGHISAAGELRLGKAMWWMLARIAGWDGN